jgi:hypothetical protein
VAGLTLLLAGYGAGLAYGVIPQRVALCVSPVAFVIAIVVVIALGAYLVLLTTILLDLMARMKVSFLHKYGLKTQAVIIQSELYHGPGLHAGDPCFKGQYTFRDQRGRTYTFEFRRECYDPYDIASRGIAVDDYYRNGAKRQVTYLGWLPAIHYLHPPHISIPLVRGNSIGLHRLE